MESGSSSHTHKTAVGWLIATIVLTACACASLPRYRLTTDLDASWVAVLEYAHTHGWQFGKDIVFTYGPLGLLSVSHFVPSVAVARIFFELAIGTGIATGLCLLAWRLAPAWRIAVLGYFVCVGTSVHLGGAAAFLDVGLFAWGWLCFLESGKRFWRFALVLLVLAAIGALVKFTFLVLGCFTVAWLAADQALQKRYLGAASLIAGFGALFLAGWCLMGQSLNGIIPFVINSAEVASGYNDTMGARSSTNETLFSVVWCFSFLAIALRASSACVKKDQDRRLRHILLALWVSGLVFEEWKYGIVRSDLGHIIIAFGFLPVAAFFSELFPIANVRVVQASRAALFISLVFVIIVLQRRQHQFFLVKCVKASAVNMANNIGAVVQPARYLREKNDEFNGQKIKTQMPQIRALVGQAPVDVFGANQGFATFNDLNLRPRPCIQSYTAYTQKLMELDEEFYRSTNAPEYVLFELQGIDGRFSPLEDARVLRELLVNYTLVSTNEYPLLRRKHASKGSLTLLKEGTTHAEEKIELAGYPNTKLWLEIEMQPTLFGRLRTFFYKPSQTQLHIWGEAAPESKISLSAPARMLSAGFVASPLLLERDDALRVYEGNKGQDTRAMAVYVPHRMLKSWKQEIRYRLYRIEE